MYIIIIIIIMVIDTAAYYMGWYSEAYEALISCCELTESQEQVKEYRSKHMGWKWISEDNRRNVSKFVEDDSNQYCNL